MSRIVHLAVKVDDLEAATRFYTEVFGFTEVKTGRNREHISRHMTDGHIDFTLMKYDSEDSHEAQLAGAGPRLHHWASQSTTRKLPLSGSSNTAAKFCPRRARVRSSSARRTARSLKS